MRSGFFRSAILPACIVFVASALLAAIFIPWNGFVDPDAFYHATISRLIWEHGPIHAYPWLDLTELGTHPADLHFAFHAFVAPFTHWFGTFDGLRIAEVLLVAACLTTFFQVLRRLKIPSPTLWTLLLATSPPFLLRLVLGKASPLAILWYLLGLMAAYLRKPWLVACAAFGFALSHGGWIYLAGSVVLLAFGELLFFRLIEGMTIRDACRKTLWAESLAGFFGAGVGLVLHPNFPDNLALSYTQVITIGLGTPFQHVVLGNEWLPTDPGVMLSNYAVWIMLILLGLMGLLFAAKKPLDKDRARLLTSLGWIFAVLTALTFKSRRNTEYLAPVVALWSATLWSLIDVKRLRETVVTAFGNRSVLARLVTPILIASFSIVLIHGMWGVWGSLHSDRLRDDLYADSMKMISERANRGDRVFHTSWDEFPMLFAHDDRLKYIAGLDPTFLYVSSSTLSDAVRDTTWGVTSTTKEAVWDVVHDRTHSRFVFVSLPSHQAFLDIIGSDERYSELFVSSSSAAFEVKE